MKILLFAVLLGLSACAKTGDPQPPLVQLPRPSADLAATQLDDGIVLTVSMPKENTDGSPVGTLRDIEVLRVAEENTKASGEIPEDEFLNRAERVLAVSDDFSKVLIGEKLVFRDTLGSVDKAAFYRRSFRYAVRFINSRNQTAGLGNQVIIAPVPVPLPPDGVSAEVSQDFIRVRWKTPAENSDGSRPARIAGYKLYRTEDPKSFPALPVHGDLLPKPELEDRDFQFDKTYYYAVSVVASAETPYAESRPSGAFAVTPVDKFAPGPPPNLQVVMEKGIVILLWTAPQAPDIAGYRIYRSHNGGDRVQLVSEPVSALSFRDGKAGPGTTCRYIVTTVDTHGNEGPAAQISIEIPPQ
jgi:hypothetical protein